MGETQNGCDTSITQNSPQSMRVWPGLRLIETGGKIPKGVFVAVAEVEPDGVRLDNGMRLKNQELLRATRPSHAVTYASCQGLTLHNRVRLDLESCHLTLRHLYVGASQATSSELRAAGGLERAARRLQGLQREVAHLEEHAPLPGHQPHVPGLHKRAAPAARELRGARHAVAGGVPEEAALQVHLALHVLALGAHLDGALQLALKLGAGDPRKGLLEDDHVVDDGLLHPIRPQLQVGARKAHAHPLGPTCAGGRGEACASPQPLRGVAGRQAPPGRAAGAAADGGAVREGQPITRAALQRPCCAVRGDCARGHGGACGAAEHSGLIQASSNPTSSPFFHVFTGFFGGATIHQK